VTDDSPLDHEPADETTGVRKLVASLPVDHIGTSVYVKGWCVPDSTRRAIVLVHDLGEHTELYRDTAYAFVRAGHSCYCFDLRGHGRSGRRLGHAPSYNVLIHDLLQVAAWVRHLEGGRSPVLVGQGIGALLVIDFTKEHGNFCQAAVLSAPCLELAAEVGFFTRTLIKILGEAWPTLRIPAALSPRFARELKHEREEEAKAHHSLATFPQLSAVFTDELLGAIRRAEARFIEYHGQVLILCPERDAICTYGKIRKAAAIHDQDNLEIVDLPGAGHNVFTDPEARGRAFDTILPWLDRLERRLAGKAGENAPRISGASREDKPFSSSPPYDLDKPGASKL
jgi:alpha-beta hydrolase superfamily lysophospholipase